MSKLLDGFDERLLADRLALWLDGVADKWRGQKRLPSLNAYMYLYDAQSEWESLGVNPAWCFQRRNIEKAMLKAIKCVVMRGRYEVVSCRKTRLCLGLECKRTGALVELVFGREGVNALAEQLLQPRRSHVFMSWVNKRGA